MLKLLSPAKINLFLKVVSKRDDGYHNLASLFQAIDLCDNLTFQLTDQNQDHLICNDPFIPTDHRNLILKAANLFRQKTKLTFGIQVTLEKRIPHQAGLGGGSSNAATTLWALNKLCGEPATIQDLASWSAEIGSDITFFLSQGTAYCTGRGEIIEPLQPLQPTRVWIIKPKQGLSTPEVFGRLDLKSLPYRDPIDQLNQFLKGNRTYFNDLELPAFSAMPALALLKEQLLEVGFETVLMSGSGSALFCIGDVNPPILPNVNYYQANFLNRAANHWFA